MKLLNTGYDICLV